jgi:hypothetical protein
MRRIVMDRTGIFVQKLRQEKTQPQTNLGIENIEHFRAVSNAVCNYDTGEDRDYDQGAFLIFLKSIINFLYG